MTINDTDKSREQRARRQLRQQGYALRKSRVRNWNIDNLGGYMVIEANRNLIVAGQRFDMSLDDVEHFIRE